MLQESLNQIKEDTLLLPRIFQAETARRKEISDEHNKAVAESKEALALRGKLEARIADLTQERDRKKQLALQAIAARQNIKSYLDEEKSKVAQLEADLAKKQEMLEEAQADRAEFMEKHDEMFSSVSALN